MWTFFCKFRNTWLQLEVGHFNHFPCMSPYRVERGCRTQGKTPGIKGPRQS